MKARDTRLGRMVAIKELIETSSFAESLFVREALITARLQHPGIVPVHEAGRWPSGASYYVMKLVSGESLQALIHRKTSLNERVALLPHVIDVIETIAYAHNQEVIHRDIKPANVLIGDFGETVVVDWGLARDDKNPVLPVERLAAELSGPGEVRSSKYGDKWQVSGNYSVSGKVVGTPAYMAPEQARAADVDKRADVYSLGALLYEVLSGKPLYSGATLGQTLDAVLAGPPVALAERLAGAGETAPPDLVAIVDKAIARDPDERYPSAKELAEDLRRFHTGKLVSAHEYSPWTLVWRWIIRNRAPVSVALASLLLLMGLAVVSINRIVAAKNVAQRERAQAVAAQHSAEDSRNKILLLQAQASLDNDPTATVAWLKQAPLVRYFTKARALFADAVARGVARHVFSFEWSAWRVKYLPDGERVLAMLHSGDVYLLDITAGTRTRIAHIPQAMYVAVAGNGARLAVGTVSGEIHMLDLTDPGSDAKIIASTTKVLAGLGFTSDGTRLVAVAEDGQDGGLQVWNVQTAALEHRLKLPLGHRMLALDASVVAAVRPDGVAVAIEVATGRELARIPLAAPAILGRISPDSRYLAVLGNNKELILADLRDGTSKTLTTGIAFTVGTIPLEFSPGGRWLACRDDEWGIHLWNLETQAYRRLRGHENNIFAFDFSGDETTLASASDDGTARIWDLTSTHVRVLRGHSDDVMRIALSADGRTVATASADKSIRVWPVAIENSACLSGHDDSLVAAAFLTRGDLVAVTYPGAIYRWDPATRKKRLIAAAQPGVSVWNWTLSPNGRFVVLPNPSRNTITVWDMDNETRRKVEWRGSRVQNIAFAPDSSAAAVFGQNGVVTVLWMQVAREPLMLHGADKICNIAVAPGGKQLAIMYARRTELVELSSGQTITRIELGDENGVCGGDNLMRTSARYAPNGEWLALTLAKSGALLLWNTQSQTLRHFEISRYPISRMVFSPNSAFLASAHHDRSFHLVNIASGAHRALGSHGDAIWDIRFSPDGARVATSSYDHQVRIWDIRSGAWRALHGHSGSVASARFSADGRRLVSASEDRTLRFWDITELIPDAATLAGLLTTTTTALISPDDQVQTPGQ
jgi:WD40 repeat protein/serine/threonine protein kinase